jgi:XisH protein
MSAKDKFHDLVKTALQKDGWMITADPLYLQSRFILSGDRLKCMLT